MTINQSQSYYNFQLSRLSQYVVTSHLQSAIPSLLLLLLYAVISSNFIFDWHSSFWILKWCKQILSAQKMVSIVNCINDYTPQVCLAGTNIEMVEVLKWDQKLSYMKNKFIFKIHLNNHRSDECCNSFGKDVSRIIFHIFHFYYYEKNLTAVSVLNEQLQFLQMFNVQCPQCRNKNRNEIVMEATDHDIIIPTRHKYNKNLSKSVLCHNAGCCSNNGNENEMK